MAERLNPGPIRGNPCIKEAVCIHSKKIFDSCRIRECIQDMRVYLSNASQETLERAVNVKPKSVELLWIYLDVEPVPFNRGFYTIDARFFYRVTADAFVGVGRPSEISGLATYDKRLILFGSEGNVRIFSSTYAPGNNDIQSRDNTNMPTAVVETVEPILLSVKVTDHNCCPCTENEISELPEVISRYFSDELVLDSNGKRLYATVGQFSIVKLERDTQLLMPAYDFCIPDKECENISEDPCDVFQRFDFPIDEFFPPAINELPIENEE